jgi:hypothetical protein
LFADNRPIQRIIERLLDGGMVEINEDHDKILRHRKNGSCGMSWFDVEGRLRCSINTMVEALGLRIEDYKPGPCYLFPLHYEEYARGKFILSVLSEETRFWVRQHQVVSKLACLRRPEPGSPPVYVSLQGEIEHLFGKPFYKELARQALPILREGAGLNGAG